MAVGKYSFVLMLVLSRNLNFYYMKKSYFGVALATSMILGVALNLISIDASATGDDGRKITCHSSSTSSNNNTFTQCSTCTVANGIGSDAGECRPANQ
jgi:hypothetical protein